MNDIVRVIGTDYIRDIKTMGLCNTNKAERNEYFAKKKILESQKSDINSIREEVDGIKSEISEIKQLLLRLVEHKN